MRITDPARLRDVSPTGLYPVRDVARRIGRGESTVRGYILAGRLEAVRHPLSGRKAVTGQALLALFGELAAAGAAAETETARETRERDDAAWAAVLGRRK